jgi:hypothetical protein
MLRLGKLFFNWLLVFQDSLNSYFSVVGRKLHSI